MTSIMSHSLPFIPLPITLGFNLSRASNMLLQAADMNSVLNKNLLISPELSRSPQHMFNNNRKIQESYDENSSVPSVGSSKQMQNSQQDDDDDRMSCCSEDSELSVGKEDENLNCSESSSHKPDVEQRLCVSPIYKNIIISSEPAESDKFSERGSVNTHEDTSCDSNRTFSQASAKTLHSPHTLFRPSPTRLQEEFLRNSQIYAEELMRQQMSIAVAARNINLSPKPIEHSIGGLMSRLENVVSSRRVMPDEPRVGFRPHLSNIESLITDNRFNVKSPDHLNFRNIHSHLNAISQITQNLSSDMHKIPSPSMSSITSRESSQSPPTTYNNLHHHQMHLMNNNSNEQNIKFSIDNILKADFGHRIGITDPIKRTKTASRKKEESRHQRHGGAAMDLTAQDKIADNNTTNMTPPEATTTTTTATSTTTASTTTKSESKSDPMVWPAWVYCTRYSDRPSSGPRVKRPKKPPGEKSTSPSNTSPQVADDKRPRTAFSGPQLARLKHEFNENRYLAEKRRQQLSAELGLNEAQIKIWFQNKRAKIKKSTGQKNPLALQLMAQGLYNHSTIPLTREEEEMQELQAAG